MSIRQTAAYSVAKVVPGGIMFVSVPILVGTVGERGYGVYSSSWALTLFISYLSSGWIRSAALRATGDAGHAMGRISPVIFVLLALVPAPPVMVWVEIATGWRHGTSSLAAMLAGGAFAVTYSVYWIITVRTQRDGRASRFAVAEAIRAATGVLATLGLLRAAGCSGATSALLGYAIATLAATAVAAGPHWPPVVGRVRDRSVLIAYWRYGWPMSLWLAASSGLVYADRFVVTTVLGPATAGRYAAVADLVVRGTSMLGSPILIALHPSIMRVWNSGDVGGAIKLLRRGTQILSVVLAAGVLGGALVGPPLLRIFVHESASWLLVGGLALGAAVWQLGQLAHKPYELIAKNAEMLVVAGVAMVVTLVLEIVLTPMLGVGGPVVALCVGACGYTVVCALAGRRLLRPPRLSGIDHSIAVAVGRA